MFNEVLLVPIQWDIAYYENTMKNYHSLIHFTTQEELQSAGIEVGEGVVRLADRSDDPWGYTLKAEHLKAKSLHMLCGHTLVLEKNGDLLDFTLSFRFFLDFMLEEEERRELQRSGWTLDDRCCERCLDRKRSSKWQRYRFAPGWEYFERVKTQRGAVNRLAWKSEILGDVAEGLVQLAVENRDLDRWDMARLAWGAWECRQLILQLEDWKKKGRRPKSYPEFRAKAQRVLDTVFEQLQEMPNAPDDLRQKVEQLLDLIRLDWTFPE